MLWAVHITDGILSAPWWLGGYAIAGVLLLFSAWRVRDDEIPRIALLTAVFFVVSIIHVRVGFTSIHLLMNGLIGMVLGPRAALAICCGLFLQYWLPPVPHGGMLTLGVNTCVLAAPAIAVWGLLRVSHRMPWLKHPWCRSSMVMLSATIWLGSLVLSVALLLTNSPSQIETLKFDAAWTVVSNPLVMLAIVAVAAGVAWVERRLENTPEFALGLLLGELAVLLTVGLNCTVLFAGGVDFGPLPPLVLLIAHLPIAVFEGVVMGFALGFLARVKPELIGMPAACAHATVGPSKVDALVAVSQTHDD